MKGSLTRVASSGRRGREWLIVFAKHPTPGQAKTRLIPRLGAAQAATLHQAMVDRTLGWARQLRAERGTSLCVFYTAGKADDMRACFGDDLNYVAQSDGDLGRRMASAFARAFDAGAERVVLVGTDAPAMRLDLAAQAFEALARCELVLGPAHDGGYYLIGLRRPQPDLFRDIEWGTHRVLAQTTSIATAQRMNYCQLEPLSDVDRPEDLPVWEAALQTPLEPVPHLISVVIPTWNEALLIPQLLASLSMHEQVEVIVADGGSTDETVALARAAGVRIVQSPAGRAYQMNTGARHARGEFILFLHADTTLPPNWPKAVRETLGTPQVACGAFRLRIAGPQWSLRWISWAANLRAKLFQLPYGDQALFLRILKFRAVAGYAEWPLLEDVDLVRRLRAHGRIALVHAAVETSPRRWNRWGVLRTTWRNAVALAAYFAGIAPDRIDTWYRR